VLVSLSSPLYTCQKAVLLMVLVMKEQEVVVGRQGSAYEANV